jgi:hypothetical protein
MNWNFRKARIILDGNKKKLVGVILIEAVLQAK